MSECWYCSLWRTRADEYLAQMKDMTGRLIAQRRQLHQLQGKAAEARQLSVELVALRAVKEAAEAYVASTASPVHATIEWGALRAAVDAAKKAEQ